VRKPSLTEGKDVINHTNADKGFGFALVHTHTCTKVV